jgi:hypothetical protein
VGVREAAATLRITASGRAELDVDCRVNARSIIGSGLGMRPVGLWVATLGTAVSEAGVLSVSLRVVVLLGTGPGEVTLSVGIRPVAIRIRGSKEGTRSVDL